jgi:hypothetical protein
MSDKDTKTEGTGARCCWEVCAGIIQCQSIRGGDAYLLEAVEDIDRTFGEGYAKEHPGLVGAFIQTCAMDFLAGWLDKKSSLPSSRNKIRRITNNDKRATSRIA